MVLALGIAACASPRLVTPPTKPVPAPAMPTTNDGLVAAIAADGAQSDHTTDAGARARLAADAARDAAVCIDRDPRAAACLYGRALALGLEARVHPTRAGEVLRTMLDSLAAAEAADSGYDEAGPARVRALVLTRAPGWPLGPGDPQEGLEAAERASSLRPDYPPNLLALGEALAKTGDSSAARAAFERARDLAQARPVGGDRDQWLHDAAQALKGLGGS